MTDAKPATDNLRDCIAAVLYGNLRRQQGIDRPDRFLDWIDTAELADAVIEELGDWTQWMDTVFVDFGLWLAEEITGRQMTRIDMESCIKDWKADDDE
jgi:hypothetical protein